MLLSDNKISTFLVLVLLAGYNYSWAGLKEDAENIIQDDFQSSVEVVFLGKVNLPKEKKIVEKKVKQSFWMDYIFAWQIFEEKKQKNLTSKENKKSIGYAFLDHVLGKVRPITFLVILDKEGVIKKTAIVKYREDYGGMVKEKRWNKQFIGFSEISNFAVGEEIDGISGATISVKSVTKGIHKIVLLFPFVINSMGFHR